MVQEPVEKVNKISLKDSEHNVTHERLDAKTGLGKRKFFSSKHFNAHLLSKCLSIKGCSQARSHFNSFEYNGLYSMKVDT